MSLQVFQYFEVKNAAAEDCATLAVKNTVKFEENRYDSGTAYYNILYKISDNIHQTVAQE